MSEGPVESPAALVTLRLCESFAPTPALVGVVLVAPATPAQVFGKDWLRLATALAHAAGSQALAGV